MTSQESNKNPYCILVSHSCIHAPLVRPHAKPKVVRSYRQHGNVTEYGKPLNPALDLQVALFASSKNTRCAATDINPFKIRFNLQITKATVNETQCRAYYVGGEGGKLPPHGGWGGIFLHSGRDFTKIMLMRATVVRPKSGENK